MNSRLRKASPSIAPTVANTGVPTYRAVSPTLCCFHRCLSGHRQDKPLETTPALSLDVESNSCTINVQITVATNLGVRLTARSTVFPCFRSTPTGNPLCYLVVIFFPFERVSRVGISSFVFAFSSASPSHPHHPPPHYTRQKRH